MMSFGVNTFIWVSPFSTASDIWLVDHARELGAEVFEIAVEDPEQIDVDVLKRALERSGLQASVCGVFGPDRDLSSDDPEVSAAAERYIRRCIDMAAQLGSPIVGGPMYTHVGKTRLLPPAEREAERGRTADRLRTLADYAAPKGVRLALEILNRFETDMLNIVEQGLVLCGEVDRPNIGLHLDTFHMHLEEKSSAGAIRLAGDRLFHFHACENDRGIPGTGQVHWQGVVEALRDVNYQGMIVIESFTPNVTSIARAVNLWRPLAPSQDAIAADGLRFLKRMFAAIPAS